VAEGENKYLRPIQAARILDVDRSTVWRHKDDPNWGLVYKEMPSGEFRYREDTVRALAARGGPPPEETDAE
jgi:hypothetical protein